jgi:glycerophosphoryl diester phosphodiesterase
MKLERGFNIIAYRGGSKFFPENSARAILNSASALPGVIIELDLQLTRDEQLIAFHDFDLQRTSTGNGNVSDFTLEELKKLKLRFPDGTVDNESTISSLDEIFYSFPGTRFILDLHENNHKLIQGVIDLVEKYNREKSIIIQSVDDKIIRVLRKLRPGWTFIAPAWETRLFVFACKMGLDRLVNTNCDIMFLPEKLGSKSVLNNKVVSILKKRNVSVWTAINFKPYENVNSYADMVRLKKFGVDGVYTDNVHALMKVSPAR